MEDHLYEPESLVEEREELMVPLNGGNSVYRKAHFLKPIFTQDQLHLPFSPTAMLSSKPTFKNLEQCTLQSYKGLTLESEKWKLWVQSLKPKYQETWKKAGIYDAILASMYTVPKDKKLIICLAERWCVDTNTFVFPWGEVAITLEDVLHLGCFSVLGASFLTPLDDQSNDIFHCLKSDFKKVKSSHCNNAPAYVWMDYFMSRGNQMEHEAFLVFWLSKFVLVRSQIALQDCHVAIHLSRGNRIALAPIVLACIYRDMRLLHNSIVRSVVLESRAGLKFNACHYDIVQMWVWERFAELRPVVNVIGSGEPRSARWNGVTNSKVNDVRTALDSAGMSFLWRPYALSWSNNMLNTLYKDTGHWIVVESDAEETYARCLRASELVGLWYTEKYLPHRVAMQFGLDQDLPSHVVTSNESPQMSWSNYNLPIRGLKLYVPPRLFESDVSSRYVVWWRGLVAINEQMVSTTRVQIEKHLPLGSYREKRDAILSATSCASLSCNLEEMPEVYVAEDGLTSVLDDIPALNSCDNVEEDSLTVAQLLHQFEKENSFEKLSDADDEMVLDNIVTPILPEDAIMSRNLKCTNEPVEMSVHSQSSTERQTEQPKDAAGNPEDSINNIEKESQEETTSELSHLGLKTRIWRLETIINMIKAEKSAGTSRGNQEE